MSPLNPPDHPTLGRCSKIQMEFVKQIKASLKSMNSQTSQAFLYNPPIILETGLKPDIKKYYIKPVLVFAPHLQCPAIFQEIKCTMSGCGKAGLKPKEWQSNPTTRYVHDVTGGLYFMSYLYQCGSCSLDKQGFEKLYKDLPTCLKSHFNVQLSKRTAFTDQFISFICTSASSTSTLMDTVKMLGSIRCTKYMEKRWQYESARDFFQKHPPITVTDTACEGFSTIDNPEGYNEILHIDFQTVVDIFCDFVEQQKPVINSIQENMHIPFCVSMDTTKKIRKRTTNFERGRRSSHVRSLENGMNFILGCDGTVLSRKAITNDSLEMVKPQLVELKMQAKKQNSCVRYIVVDNCCQSRGSIQAVFSEKTEDGQFITSIVQDVKHLINRPLEMVNKTHKLYASFVADFHGAVTDGGKKMKVKSRNGEWANVDAPLDSSDVIWRRLESIVTNYEKSLRNGGEELSALFLKGFENDFNKQKYHWLNCVQEIYDEEGKHYYESRADMDFHLYRGTNRNEAWHKKLNSIYPVRCGERLGDACLDAVIVAHNLDHCTGITRSSFGGIDPAIFRLGNLPYLLRLISLQGSDEKITSSITYSDMCLVRSSPEKQRVAIGIRMTADEQIRRDYGPLKNSTGTTSHKSSQNMEIRGSKSRPGLTIRDFDRNPKRIKMNHFWTDIEKQTLVEIVSASAESLSKNTLDWRRVYSMLREKYDWAEFMEIATVKSIYYQHLKISRTSSNGLTAASEANSTISSSVSNMQGQESATCASMSNTQEQESATCASVSNVQEQESAICASVSNVQTCKEDKDYQLIFTRKHYEWNEIQSVTLLPAEKQQQFSKNEDDILLHLTSNKKYKTGSTKKTFDWKHIHRDFLVWCKYFTLHSLGKCIFFDREHKSLRDRYKNLNRAGSR
jgi:hypothetical protein